MSKVSTAAQLLLLLSVSSTGTIQAQGTDVDVTPLIPAQEGGQHLIQLWSELEAVSSRPLPEIRDFTLPIDSRADWDEYKGTKTILNVPDGYFFCGYKLELYSAASYSYSAHSITGTGFVFETHIQGSKSIFNQTRAWFIGTVHYRGFRLGPGASPPNCDTDGYSTRASSANNLPVTVASYCQLGVMYCRRMPTDSPTACGVCAPTITTP